MSILTIVHSLRYPLVRLMNSSHHTSYAVYTILPIGYDTKFHNRIIYCIFRVQSQKLSTLTLTRPCGGQSVHLVPTTPRREFRVLFPSQPHISPRIHQGPPSAAPNLQINIPENKQSIANTPHKAHTLSWRSSLEKSNMPPRKSTSSVTPADPDESIQLSPSAQTDKPITATEQQIKARAEAGVSVEVCLPRHKTCLHGGKSKSQDEIKNRRKKGTWN